jgi:cytochrome c5
MRLIHSSITPAVLCLTLLGLASRPANTAKPPDGQTIFRFDTFGDEQLWTDVLRMHEVLPAVNPQTALDVGLKVDSAALPAEVIAAIKSGDADLTDPALTVALLRLNAVVGVMGKVDDAGSLVSVGITCALCHSTVDNSVAPGIGVRRDGWANRDLNVGAILALSPFFAADADLVSELTNWGPGKYDPRHHVFDGTDVVIRFPDTLPVVIPPAYGLRGVGFETFTGDGPIAYWNAYVGISQMGGKGSFHDPRIDLTITQPEDLISAKLPALVTYQQSLKAPPPPKGSFDPSAAARGSSVFRRQARCATCHPVPEFTDVGRSNAPILHPAGETGTEAEYATRSATGQYRATPLRALWQHPPYFHDGSASNLAAVVEHYDKVLNLGLTVAQKADLVQYLRSL